MNLPRIGLAVALAAAAGTPRASAEDVGDPQVATDHPWYPGELSCSTFERLFKTQAELYTRVTGREVRTDEDKALASWFWRNLNYWHGEEGTEDLWGKGWHPGEPPGNYYTRDYWTGLFAHGFGLCYTSHIQYAAEMDALFGRGRGRGTGVVGHYSFEVFLTGGPYGEGRWALLDHDISTVIFNAEGTMLLGTAEIQADVQRLADRAFRPERQRGWPMSPYTPTHAMAYREFGAVAYDAGYAGPPPRVHLRRGETLRRYLRPGLGDGQTFVFWGRNYGAGGVPGPERPSTWVNQPEKFYRGPGTTGWKEGRARYANAVYTYTPDFSSGDYREGVVEEDDSKVVFEFTTPYVIAATPAGDGPWAVYEPGCRNGLVLRGRAACPVSLSTDRGRTWQDCGTFKDGLDLTDRVKGRRQYRLRFGAGARALAGTNLSIVTVCQASGAVMPRLKDGGSRVRFEASDRAVVSAGSAWEEVKTHVVEGQLGGPSVVLSLGTPRGETPAEVYAAAMVESWNPPRPNVRHAIEVSTDEGKTWKPVVKDWMIVRRPPEPKAFSALSCVWGRADVPSAPVRVRFSNDRGMVYPRAEAHLVYRTAGRDATRVTFAWSDDRGARRESRVFGRPGGEAWTVDTGKGVETRWVEFEPVPAR
jgi:hypothetical protein